MNPFFTAVSTVPIATVAPTTTAALIPSPSLTTSRGMCNIDVLISSPQTIAKGARLASHVVLRATEGSVTTPIRKAVLSTWLVTPVTPRWFHVLRAFPTTKGRSPILMEGLFPIATKLARPGLGFEHVGGAKSQDKANNKPQNRSEDESTIEQ